MQVSIPYIAPKVYVIQIAPSTYRIDLSTTFEFAKNCTGQRTRSSASQEEDDAAHLAHSRVTEYTKDLFKELHYHQRL
ncbi:hypothetical protein LshimejAT787_0501740 [Lyophyllum shimeji]|uniref:Uncharacterized protein n=1 Tax=Lyophyllum shimeji TaxID=47721 RepID=A0A9P3PMT2_LYOSH|nr:hypothetical protein LshimejAT787_0501740 [Lyophyllum shimeji]